MEGLREKYIEDSCPFIFFNSWKFSQFNLSDQLLTNMVASLTAQLEKGIERKEKSKKADDILRLMNNLARVGGLVIHSAVKEKFGVDISGTVEEAEWRGASEPDTDYIALINKLQSNFQQLIYERLGITTENRDSEEYKNKRVIFFVDDLDRLSPDKAIEVLEVLKLFLDCKHCVFLLAIDYDVVVNGVKIKYKNSLSEEKGKEFFEKMIQVVYTLPNYLSHTETYVKEILEQNKLSPLLAAEFAGLLKNGRKDNPRSIKRLINSFVLLDRMKMHYNKEPLSTESSVMLFAALCLQNICPEVYSFWSEQFNNSIYNYVDGKAWFNEFIEFCYGVLQGKVSAEAWERPYELRQMALYETASDERLDRTKIQFLFSFLEKIYDVNHRKECYCAPFSGGRYKIEDIINLRNALQFTIVKNSFGQSKLESTIPLIRVGSGMRYTELSKGTGEEAYKKTVQRLLESVENNVWIENNRELGWRQSVCDVEEIVKELDWMLSVTKRKDGIWEGVSCGEKTFFLLMKPQSDGEQEEEELAVWRANTAGVLAKKVNTSFEWLACINGKMHTIYEYHAVDDFGCAPPFQVCFIAYADSPGCEVESRTIAEAYYRTVSVCMQDLLDAEGWDRVNDVIEEMDFLFTYDDLKENSESIEVSDIVKEWSPEERSVYFKDGCPVALNTDADSFDFEPDEFDFGTEDFTEEPKPIWYFEEEKVQGAVLSGVEDETGQREFYVYTDISTFQMLDNLEKLTNITKTRYVWYKDPYMFDEVVHGYWKFRGDRE